MYYGVYNDNFCLVTRKSLTDALMIAESCFNDAYLEHRFDEIEYTIRDGDNNTVVVLRMTNT